MDTEKMIKAKRFDEVEVWGRRYIYTNVYIPLVVHVCGQVSLRVRWGSVAVTSQGAVR